MACSSNFKGAANHLQGESSCVLTCDVVSSVEDGEHGWLWATHLGPFQHRLDLTLAEQTGCQVLPACCTPQVLSQEREKCCVRSLLCQRQNHPSLAFQHVCGCFSSQRIIKEIDSGKCLLVKTKGWAAAGCADCCILLLTFTWKDKKLWGKLSPLKSNKRKGWYFSWGFEVRSLHQRDYSSY